MNPVRDRFPCTITVGIKVINSHPPTQPSPTQPSPPQDGPRRLSTTE
jgi:hypothetical protein